LTGDDVPSVGRPEVDRLPLETTAPLIIAAGDVRHGSNMAGDVRARKAG
jgi:hypothetical protein